MQTTSNNLTPTLYGRVTSFPALRKFCWLQLFVFPHKFHVRLHSSSKINLIIHRSPLPCQGDDSNRKLWVKHGPNALSSVTSCNFFWNALAEGICLGIGWAKWCSSRIGRVLNVCLRRFTSKKKAADIEKICWHLCVLHFMLKLVTAHRFQIWDWTGFLPSPKMIQGLGMGPHDQQIVAANDRNTSTKKNMCPSDFVPPMSYLLSVNVIYCKWMVCRLLVAVQIIS